MRLGRTSNAGLVTDRWHLRMLDEQLGSSLVKDALMDKVVSLSRRESKVSKRGAGCKTDDAFPLSYRKRGVAVTYSCSQEQEGDTISSKSRPP